MKTSILPILIAALMGAGCAVSDLPSLPDFSRDKSSGGKAAAGATPVLIVFDGENGPSSCQFEPLVIYQPGVPTHSISFSSTQRSGGRVVGTGGGEFMLPVDKAFEQQSADGLVQRIVGSSADVACDQVELQISMDCKSGSCPPYVTGDRSDRGDRVPMTLVLTTSF